MLGYNYVNGVENVKTKAALSVIRLSVDPLPVSMIIKRIKRQKILVVLQCIRRCIVVVVISGNPDPSRISPTSSPHVT